MKFKLGSTLLVGLLLSACSGIAVQQDYLPGTDFTSLRTWDWMPTPTRRSGDSRIDSETMAARLKTAVEEGLLAKGFQKVTSGEPDFRVGYQIMVADGTDSQTVNNYWGPTWTYGALYGPGTRGAMGVSSGATVGGVYSVGSMVLDFFSVRSHELVWRGTAEGKLLGQATPAERQERATDVVEKILSQFPPKR